MDKCPKNMTLVALNIFGLITILDFFQDAFVSIFKTKRPSDYFAFFSFLLCGGQAYFYIFYLVSWVAPLAVGHIFLIFFIFYSLFTHSHLIMVNNSILIFRYVLRQMFSNNKVPSSANK